MKHQSRVRIGGALVTLGMLVLVGYILLAFEKFSGQTFDYTYEINEKRLTELSRQNIDALKIEFERSKEAVRIA